MIKFAKEVLLEENYIKFIKSYKFTFWFQLIGILFGFVIPSVVFMFVIHDIAGIGLGAAVGILWMCIFLPISQFMPQARIYRKFSKWYRKRHATLDELDIIFYE